MLTLIKLHRAANPDADNAELTRNVKRKFLNGISPELKKNIFIFCSDPHAQAATVEKLLEAVRKARLHIMERNILNINTVEIVSDTKNDQVYEEFPMTENRGT